MKTIQANKVIAITVALSLAFFQVMPAGFAARTGRPPISIITNSPNQNGVDPFKPVKPAPAPLTNEPIQQGDNPSLKSPERMPPPPPETPAAVTDYINGLNSNSQLQAGYKAQSTLLADGRYLIQIVDNRTDPTGNPSFLKGELSEVRFIMDATKGPDFAGTLAMYFHDKNSSEQGASIFQVGQASLLYEGMKILNKDLILPAVVGAQEQAALSRLTKLTVDVPKTEGEILFKEEGTGYNCSKGISTTPKVEKITKVAEIPFGLGGKAQMLTYTDFVTGKVTRQVARLLRADGSLIKEYQRKDASYGSGTGVGLYVLDFLTADGLRVIIKQNQGKTIAATVDEISTVKNITFGDVSLKQQYSLQSGQLVKVSEAYSKWEILSGTNWGQMTRSTAFVVVNGLLQKSLVTLSGPTSVAGRMVEQQITYVNGLVTKIIVMNNATLDRIVYEGTKVTVSKGTAAGQIFTVIGVTVKDNPNGFLIPMTWIVDATKTLVAKIDAKGNILFEERQSIPLAVQTYAKQLSDLLNPNGAMNFTISAPVLQSDKTYLVTVSDARAHLLTPTSGLNNMSFNLDSQGNLIPSSLKMTVYGYAKPLAGNDATVLDGALTKIFRNPFAPGSVDYLARNLQNMEVVKILSAENGVVLIRIEKYGKNYKCFLAAGQVVVEEDLPATLQDFLKPLADGLSSYKVTALLIAGSNPPEYRVSITPKDGSVPVGVPAILKPGQLRSLTFLVGADAALHSIESVVYEGIAGVNPAVLYAAADRMLLNPDVEMSPGPGEAWRVVAENLLRMAGMIVTQVDLNFTIHYTMPNGDKYNCFLENGNAIVEREITLPSGTVLSIRTLSRTDMLNVVNAQLSGSARDAAITAIGALPGNPGFYRTTEWVNGIAQSVYYECSPAKRDLSTTKPQKLSLPGKAMPNPALVQVFAASGLITPFFESKMFFGQNNFFLSVVSAENTQGATPPVASLARTFSLGVPPFPSQHYADIHYDALGNVTKVVYYQYNMSSVPELQTTQGAVVFPSVMKFFVNSLLTHELAFDATGKILSVTVIGASSVLPLPTKVEVYSGGNLYSQSFYDPSAHLTRVMLLASGKSFRYEYTPDSFDSKGRLVYYKEINEMREKQGLPSSRNVWFDPNLKTVLAETNFDGVFSLYENHYSNGKLVAKATIQSPAFTLRRVTLPSTDDTPYSAMLPVNAGEELRRNTDVICSGAECTLTTVNAGYYTTYEAYDANGRVLLFKGGRTATDDAGTVGRRTYVYTLDASGLVSKSIEAYIAKAGARPEITTRFFLTPGQNTTSVPLAGYNQSYSLSAAPMNGYQAIAVPVAWNLFGNVDPRQLENNGYGTLMALSREGMDANGETYSASSFFTYRLATGGESSEPGTLVVSDQRTIYKKNSGDGYYEELGNNYYNQYGDLVSQYVKRVNLASFAPPQVLTSLPMELYNRQITILSRNSLRNMARSVETVRYEPNFLGGTWSPVAGLLREEIVTEFGLLNDPQTFEKQQFFIGSTVLPNGQSTERIKLFFAERSNGEKVIGVLRIPTTILGGATPSSFAVVLDANGLPLRLEYAGQPISVMTNAQDNLTVDRSWRLWNTPSDDNSAWEFGGQDLVSLHQLDGSLSGIQNLSGGMSAYRVRDILFETLLDPGSVNTVNRTGSQVAQIPDSFFQLATASLQSFLAVLPYYDPENFKIGWKDAAAQDCTYSYGGYCHEPYLNATRLKNKIEELILAAVTARGYAPGEGSLYEMAVRRAGVAFFFEKAASLGSWGGMPADIFDVGRSLLASTSLDLSGSATVASTVATSVGSFQASIQSLKANFAASIMDAQHVYFAALQTDPSHATEHLMNDYAAAIGALNAELKNLMAGLQASLEETYRSAGLDENGESLLFQFVPREALFFTANELNIRVQGPTDLNHLWDGGMAVNAALAFIDSDLNRIKKTSAVGAELFSASLTFFNTVANETVLTFGGMTADRSGVIQSILENDQLLKGGSTSGLPSTLDSLINEAQNYKNTVRAAQLAYQTAVRNALGGEVEGASLERTLATGGYVRTNYGLTLQVHGTQLGLEDVVTGFSQERIVNFTTTLFKFYSIYNEPDTDPAGYYAAEKTILDDLVNQANAEFQDLQAGYTGIRGRYLALGTADDAFRIANDKLNALHRIFLRATGIGGTGGFMERKALWDSAIPEFMAAIEPLRADYTSALDRLEVLLCNGAGCETHIATQGFKTALLLRKVAAAQRSMNQYSQVGGWLQTMYNENWSLADAVGMDDGPQFGFASGPGGSQFLLQGANAEFIATARAITETDRVISLEAVTRIAELAQFIEGLSAEAENHEASLRATLLGGNASDPSLVSALVNNIFLLHTNFTGMAASAQYFSETFKNRYDYALADADAWEAMWSEKSAAYVAHEACGTEACRNANIVRINAAVNVYQTTIYNASLAQDAANQQSKDELFARMNAVQESYSNDTALIANYLMTRHDFYEAQVGSHELSGGIPLV